MVVTEQHPTGNREWKDYDGVRKWVAGQLMSDVYGKKDHNLQKHSHRSSPQLVPLIGLTKLKLVPLLGVDRQTALHPEVEWDVHDQ